LIFDYDPKGRHKSNEIDLKVLLNRARDIKWVLIQEKKF
jgi:hypothetical protein